MIRNQRELARPIKACGSSTKGRKGFELQPNSLADFPRVEKNIQIFRSCLKFEKACPRYQGYNGRISFYIRSLHELSEKSREILPKLSSDFSTYYIQRQYFYIVAFYYNIYVPNNQLYTILLLFYHRLFAQSFSIIVPSYKYKIQNVVKSCFIEI